MIPFSRRSIISSGIVTAAVSNGEFDTAGNVDRGHLVNVRTFGAKGDGISDDAVAINAAAQFLRKQQIKLANFGIVPKLVFPTGIYAISHSIDLTGLQGINIVVEGDSSVILGSCRGEPVIDALGSRWLTIRDLTLIGDKTSPPRVGIQIGRTKNGVVADDHYFENLKILGHFSLACLLNLAAETTGFEHLLLWNDFPSAQSYCLIQDGLNHFDTASVFLPHQSAARERDDSFNENEFINCDFRHSGGGVPVWLGDTARHRFIRCYAAGRGATAFIIYCGPNSHTMLDVDCHFETNRLGSSFLFTGPSLRPVIRGFSYKDHEIFAADSVFRCDTHVNRVTLHNARIEIAGFFGRSCKVFDDPSRWAVTGSYYSEDIMSWNGAECFTGAVQLGSEWELVGQVGMKAPSGLTHERPTGLTDADAGRLFLDSSLAKLIIWSGSEWIDTTGQKI